MGLGLLASIVGCLKFIDFNEIITTTDPTYVMVIWKMGSLAEAKIGMIAANLPPLKSWGEGMLVKVRSGIFVSKRSSSEGTVWVQREISQHWQCAPEEKRSESNQILDMKAKLSPQLAIEQV
jgi:hypothetical protein